MIIDAHQHFWALGRGDYDWMTPDLGVIYRDFLPDDLRPLLAQAGVDMTILVQAAQTEAETEFLLNIAEQTDFVAGVVGWLDLEDTAFAAKLDALLTRPKFVGLRPMLQGLDDDAYILRPRVVDSLRHIAEREVAFDFLTFPRHLPHVLQALDLVPNLRGVIDHISKPPIASGALEPWKGLMTEIAKRPNVSCKLSGMVTEADAARWTPGDLEPYVHHMVAAFGPQRLIFGSDWPVALSAASYQEVLDALLTLLRPVLTSDEIAGVLGGNAQRFYGLSGTR